MKARVVVDAAIVGIADALGAIARVDARPADAIDRAALRDADVLVVRSVTRVGPALLEGSRVGLVVTATTGTDHLDLPGLATASVEVTTTAGANANAVAQYVFAALGTLGGPLPDPLGVVGLGRIGRRVARYAQRLGATVLACDPPLASARPQVPDDDPDLVALARDLPLHPLPHVLAHAEAITVHVPRTEAGPHATRGLLDADAIARLRRGATILHTSRGGVVADDALLGWLDAGEGRAVLDVFEREPAPPPALLAARGGRVLATPHVAGYTRQAKREATRRAVASVARHLGVAAPALPAQAPPPPLVIEDAAALGADPHDAARVALAVAAHLGALPGDHTALRDAAAGERASVAFEALRRGYRLRDEHQAIRVRVPPGTATQGLAALDLSVEG